MAELHPIEQSLQALAPEDGILLLCCRDRLDPSCRHHLKAALRTGPDWQRLLDRAIYHRLHNLLRYHLQQADALGDLPEGVRRTLDDEVKSLYLLQQRQKQSVLLCLDAFGARGIDVMLMKGPLLQDLYPEGVVRVSHDLDLLIREADFHEARLALQEIGFNLETRIPDGLSAWEVVQFSQYVEQLRFVKPNRPAVELHFRLYNFGLPDPHEDVWQRARTQKIDGRQVLVLPPEELLLYLSIHANLHAFGRMQWFYDITSLYWRRRDRLDWDLIASRARERKLLSSFYHSLLWISQLVYPERSVPELAPMKPSAFQTKLFGIVWRRKDVFALKSLIRPFDAAAYYLLGSESPLRKLRYMLRVLFPPVRWLAVYLGRTASPFIHLHYMRKRRQERRRWDGGPP